MKMLDFNALQQPTWPIKLRDEAQTVVNLSAPTVDLFDRLMAAVPELQAVTQTKDGRIVTKAYALVADLMNCNEDGRTFTGDELLTVYKMTLVDVVVFVSGYLSFVQEITEAKN